MPIVSSRSVSISERIIVTEGNGRESSVSVLDFWAFHNPSAHGAVAHPNAFVPNNVYGLVALLFCNVGRLLV